MFARTLHVTYRTDDRSPATEVPLAWLDSFAMRNFTNSAEFDDLLPVAAGSLEAGYRVSLPALSAVMEAWFRRKGWLPAQARLYLAELPATALSGFSPATPHRGAS